MKKIVTGLVILLAIATVSTCAAAADTPVIGTLQISPETPAPRTTVTVTIDISGTVDYATVTYHECNTQLCHKDSTLNMTKSGTTYTAQVPLQYADSINATFFVTAHTGSGTTDSAKKVILIHASSNNNNTNGSTNKKTPGFEVIIALGAIAVAMLVIARRKRSS